MANRSYLILFPLFLASVMESHVVKRQANYNSCSGGDGLYADTDDCSQFLSCEGGKAYVMACGPGTEFDPNTRQCGWPSQANTGCRRTGQANVKAEIAALCSNPSADHNGNIPETFLMGHPTICNSFFICTFNYVYNPCVICGAGMYFPEGQGNCVANPKSANIQDFCNGRRYVGHNDSTAMREDPLCSTLLEPTNPPFYPQTTPYYG